MLAGCVFEVVFCMDDCVCCGTGGRGAGTVCCWPYRSEQAWVCGFNMLRQTNRPECSHTLSFIFGPLCSTHSLCSHMYMPSPLAPKQIPEVGKIYSMSWYTLLICIPHHTLLRLTVHILMPPPLPPPPDP
jgi:hypothetical protein